MAEPGQDSQCLRHTFSHIMTSNVAILRWDGEWLMTAAQSVQLSNTHSLACTPVNILASVAPQPPFRLHSWHLAGSVSLLCIYICKGLLALTCGLCLQYVFAITRGDSGFIGGDLWWSDNKGKAGSWQNMRDKLTGALEVAVVPAA